MRDCEYTEKSYPRSAFGIYLIGRAQLENLRRCKASIRVISVNEDIYSINRTHFRVTRQSDLAFKTLKATTQFCKGWVNDRISLTIEKGRLSEG